MRTYVINARFAAMRMTGVQRSAHEIVSRLLLDEPERFCLVSPKLDAKSVPSLPLDRQGRIRRGHLWEQVELPRMVSEAGKDAVLYSPMTSGPVAVGSQVMTVHDLFAVEHPEWYSRAFSTWYRFLMPRLARRVSRILVNSEYTRRRVLERFGVSEEKLVLCRFAQDERFAPAPQEEVERFRAGQGLPERYLLCVASIEPRKNLATLISAWRRSEARKQGVKLLIAGGAARKAVFNTANTGADAAEDPTIQLLGFFADEHLPLLYQGAAAFALPSLAEGFGLPVLEAMACGTPVICSDATALPDTAGGAARLVPALETEAWAEAIDAVFSSPELRRRMRSAGLRRAGEFSWESAAKTVRGALDLV